MRKPALAPRLAVPRRELLVGLTCAAIVVAVWTSFLLVSRAGAVGTLLPFDMAALRFGVAGLVMLPLLLRSGLSGLRLRQALLLVVTAGLGFPLLAYAAFALAPAAHGGVMMTGTLPLWTAVLAALLLGERLGGARLASLVLILLGVAALAAPLRGASAAILAGDLLFAGASLSWAVYTIAARAWAVPPLAATAIVAVGAAVLYLPVYLLFLPKGLAATPWTELVGQGLFQGIIAVIVSLLAFTRAVAALGPGPTTMIAAVVPGLGAVLAVPVLGERLEAAAVLGLVLVSLGMAGSVLALMRQTR
ncbi:DMT family transporter [Geminicoccaceae bacterium 1502E]|nr:DMT family transporter [Geminicoccaceae bacterium 1502E]